jgi:hypothetical protein
MRCAAMPDAEGCEQNTTPAGTSMSGLRVPSVYANDGKVREVLAAVAAQHASKRPLLYGRRDVVTDWSQFAPRGHYTPSAVLKRYFRTMMWLGRAELGFSLSPSHAAFGERDPGSWHRCRPGPNGSANSSPRLRRDRSCPGGDARSGASRTP